jgi:hypothetical protein
VQKRNGAVVHNARRGAGKVGVVTFHDAAVFIMPFGKYKGQNLDVISSSNEGLKYLDWLLGDSKDVAEPWYLAVATYLADPSIKKELESL